MSITLPVPPGRFAARSFAALLVAGTLAACSSSRPPDTQVVTVYTPDVASARCILVGADGREIIVAGTPGEAMINRRSGPYGVSCTAPGFAPATLKLVGIETGTSEGMPLFPPDVVVDMRLQQTAGAAVAARVIAAGVTRRRATAPSVAVAKPAPPIPGAFSVQVGAYRRPENARRMVNWLQARGYAVQLVPGPDMTRVRFGSYATRDEAARAARRYKRAEGRVAFSVRN